MSSRPLVAIQCALTWPFFRKLPPQVLVRVVEYRPTASPRGRAAYILSASKLGGRPYLNYLWVAAMPKYSDLWTVYISAVSAPAEVFREELPTFLKIWGSYSVNPAIFAERLQHAAETMKSTAEMVRATMAERPVPFAVAMQVGTKSFVACKALKIREPVGA